MSYKQVVTNGIASNTLLSFFFVSFIDGQDMDWQVQGMEPLKKSTRDGNWNYTNYNIITCLNYTNWTSKTKLKIVVVNECVY